MLSMPTRGSLSRLFRRAKEPPASPVAEALKAEAAADTDLVGAAGWREVWSVMSPYFLTSSQKWKARLHLGTAVGLTMGLVGGEVMMNYWWNDFITAMQTVLTGNATGSEKLQIFALLGKYALLCGGMVAGVAAKQNVESRFHTGWREWMTENYVDRWLDDRTHYRLSADKDNPVPNPDQRLSVNIRDLTGESIWLGMGILKGFVSFPAFAFVLWNLSGTLRFPVMGYEVSIPGFLMWGAVAYAGLGTWLAHQVGKPLAGLHYRQQRNEGDFRNNITHIRNNAESIALYGGETAEKKSLSLRFAKVTANLLKINAKETRLTVLRDSYNRVGQVLPYALFLPKAFLHGAKWGEFAAAAHAFNEVQSSLSQLFYSYTAIARMRARVLSLHEFDVAMDKAKAEQARKYPDHGGPEKAPEAAAAPQPVPLPAPAGG